MSPVFDPLQSELSGGLLTGPMCGANRRTFSDGCWVGSLDGVDPLSFRSDLKVRPGSGKPFRTSSDGGCVRLGATLRSTQVNVEALNKMETGVSRETCSREKISSPLARSRRSHGLVVKG